MIDVTKIRLSQDQILGGNYGIITKITPAMKYVDNKPTDEIDGYKVEVIAIANKSYDKVSVKVAEKPEISQEDIDAANTPIQISFTGFEAKIYRSYKSNTFELSCKAKSVQFFGNKSK